MLLNVAFHPQISLGHLLGSSSEETFVDEMVHFMDPRKTGTEDLLYSWCQVCGLSFVSQLKSLRYLQNPHKQMKKKVPEQRSSLSLSISLMHSRKGNFVQNLTSAATLRQLLGEREQLLRSICSLPNPASGLPGREIFYFSPPITDFYMTITISSIKYYFIFQSDEDKRFLHEMCILKYLLQLLWQGQVVEVLITTV